MTSITPTQVFAAIQAAQGAVGAIQSVAESGLSFAQQLHNQWTEQPQRQESGFDSARFQRRLESLRDQLTDRLSAAGVDLGFDIALTADGQLGFQLDNMHLDEAKILETLASAPELLQEFEALENQLRSVYGEHGRLRVEFRDGSLEHSFT